MEIPTAQTPLEPHTLWNVRTLRLLKERQLCDYIFSIWYKQASWLNPITHAPAWWNEQMCLSYRRSSCMHPSKCQQCGSCSSVAAPGLGSCMTGGGGLGGPHESTELSPWSPHKTTPRKPWMINTDLELCFILLTVVWVKERMWNGSIQTRKRSTDCTITTQIPILDVFIVS